MLFLCLSFPPPPRPESRNTTRETRPSPSPPPFSLLHYHHHVPTLSAFRFPSTCMILPPLDGLASCASFPSLLFFPLFFLLPLLFPFKEETTAEHKSDLLTRGCRGRSSQLHRSFFLWAGSASVVLDTPRIALGASPEERKREGERDSLT